MGKQEGNTGRRHNLSPVGCDTWNIELLEEKAYCITVLQFHCIM